jgi:hypothetical protein
LGQLVVFYDGSLPDCRLLSSLGIAELLRNNRSRCDITAKTLFLKGGNGNRYIGKFGTGGNLGVYLVSLIRHY